MHFQNVRTKKYSASIDLYKWNRYENRPTWEKIKMSNKDLGYFQRQIGDILTR